jgi:hypothetical protein
MDVLFHNHKTSVSRSTSTAFATAAGGGAGGGGAGSSEDGVHAFSLLSALLDGIEDESEVDNMMKLLVGTIESYKLDDKKGTNDKALSAGQIMDKKLKLLCALYNLRHDGKEKCWILSRILHTCAYSGDDESVLSLLPGRDSTLGTLLEKNNLGTLLAGLEKEGNQGLSCTDKRVLYSTASAVTAKVEEVCKAKGMDKDASTANGSKQRFLLKMLSTYATIDDVDEEALVAAKQAAIGAISDPISLFNEQRCIMSLPPVMALEKDQGKFIVK